MVTVRLVMFYAKELGDFPGNVCIKFILACGEVDRKGRVMRARILTALATILIATCTPAAHGIDDWMSAPDYPAGGIQGAGYPGVRLGHWLPCKEDWYSFNDCIESVSLEDITTGKSVDLIFSANKDFDPLKQNQEWSGASDMTGVFRYSNPRWLVYPGSWKVPDGFSISGSFDVSSFLGDGRVMTRVRSAKGDTPENIRITVVLRSQNFPKYAGWFIGNVKDPAVTFPTPNTIKISAIAQTTPIASVECAKLALGNSEKASGTESGLVVNLQGQGGAGSKAGDVVVGTNGWWCFKGLEWDAQNQQLVAKVGTAHYDQDGQILSGWLEAKIKGSIAKKWWGMDPRLAVGYAKVEITYEDGTKSIATVNAKYDAINDWIDLRAYNFHFSTPAVRMAFVNPEIKQGTSVATSGKKISITCIKGKITKKITALSPVCPKGYKKK